MVALVSTAGCTGGFTGDPAVVATDPGISGKRGALLREIAWEAVTSGGFNGCGGHDKRGSEAARECYARSRSSSCGEKIATTSVVCDGNDTVTGRPS